MFGWGVKKGGKLYSGGKVKGGGVVVVIVEAWCEKLLRLPLFCEVSL